MTRKYSRKSRIASRLQRADEGEELTVTLPTGSITGTVSESGDDDEYHYRVLLDDDGEEYTVYVDYEIEEGEYGVESETFEVWVGGAVEQDVEYLYDWEADSEFPDQTVDEAKEDDDVDGEHLVTELQDSIFEKEESIEVIERVLEMERRLLDNDMTFQEYGDRLDRLEVEHGGELPNPYK